MMNTRTAFLGLWSDLFGNRDKQGSAFVRTSLTNSDGEYVDVDGYTEALSTIEEVHKKIHDGEHYKFFGYIELGLNDVSNIAIKTPLTGLLHFSYLAAVTYQTLVQTFEDATIDTDGLEVSAMNSNRNSSNTSDAVITLEPTVLDYGTELPLSKVLGSRADSGQDVHEKELILKKNTTYVFKATSFAASNYTNLILDYYETGEI